LTIFDLAIVDSSIRKVVAGGKYVSAAFAERLATDFAEYLPRTDPQEAGVVEQMRRFVRYAVKLRLI